MNKADDLPGGPDTKIHIPIQEDLTSPLPTDQGRHLRKLAGAALPLDPHRLLRHAIREQATRILPAAQHELGIRLVGIDDRLFDIDVDGRFKRAHEASPHIDTSGAESEGSSKALAVSEAAAGDEGDGEALTRAAQQDEVRDVALADVAGAFEAVDGEEVDAQFGGGLRVSNRRAFVEDGAVGGFEELDYGTRAVARGFDDFDAFGDDGAGVGGVVRRVEAGEEGEVYAELVGRGLALVSE